MLMRLARAVHLPIPPCAKLNPPSPSVRHLGKLTASACRPVCRGDPSVVTSQAGFPTDVELTAELGWRKKPVRTQKEDKVTTPEPAGLMYVQFTLGPMEQKRPSECSRGPRKNGTDGRPAPYRYRSYRPDETIDPDG